MKSPLIPLLFSLFLFSNLAQADGPRFICATPHLTTSYVLQENAAGFELQVAHHNGVKFMPIHEGLITGYDLKLLAEKAAVLEQMGNHYSVSFKKSECTNSQGEWACIRPGKIKIGNLEAQNIAFKLSQRKTITKRSEYNSYFLDFSLSKDNYGYSSPMEYPAQSCTFR